MADTHNNKFIFFFNEIIFYRKQICIDLKIKRVIIFTGHRIIWSSNFKAQKQQREGGTSSLQSIIINFNVKYRHEVKIQGMTGPH